LEVNSTALISIVLACLAVLTGGWLVWQLLRQNGRLLLRVEELEKRLDEWELSEPDGNHQAEARSEESAIRHPSSANDPSLVTSTLRSSATEDGAAARNRSSDHSLARSRIKRDGLKAGTLAPDFKLPLIDGRGDLSLEELRGQRVLLVFSDPDCGPCNALSPHLEKLHRQQTEREVGRVTPCAPHDDELSRNGAQRTARPTVVMISRGAPRENRAKVKEHGLTFPIVLQQQWEISRRYAMFATPIAYLIDEQGTIAREVAMGIDAIQQLMKTLNAGGMAVGALVDRGASTRFGSDEDAEPIKTRHAFSPTLSQP
jgi:peroxiredoxin